VRLAVAGQRVVDEDQAELAAHPDVAGLSLRHRSALRLADAMMTRPDSLTDTDRAALRQEFSTAELVEMTIDVMKWNAQKTPVALGVDVEVRTGVLTDLVFDDEGHWVRPQR
jgi:hypothetical protein